VYFVDLPGFGYARGGSNAAVELAAVAEGYFGESGSGGGGSQAAPLLLVDSRHPGLASDIQAYAWFAENATAPHVVATKVDKLSRAERARNLKALEDTFGTAALPVSATSGEGLDELWTLIAKLARNR
jgi:GTP-binding protein